MKDKNNRNRELTKIIDGNRITIPKDMMKILGAKLGDWVSVEIFPVEPLLVLTVVEVKRKDNNLLDAGAGLFLGYKMFKSKSYLNDNKEKLQFAKDKD